MADRPAPPLAPYLSVHDAADAIDFYQRAFAATEVERVPADDGKRIMHASLEINGGLVMLSDDFPEFHDGQSSAPRPGQTSPVVLQLECADVDAAWRRATEAGATVRVPLADMFWGARYGQIVDPFGHRWALSAPSRK